MKKFLSILSVIAVLCAAVLTICIPTFAADEWSASADATVNADGSVSIPTFASATWNEAIDFTAKDLDVAVTFKAPLANTSQFVCVYVSKDIPTSLDITETMALFRFGRDDAGKIGINHTVIGTTGLSGSAYGGGFLPLNADTEYVLRFKYDASMDKIVVSVDNYGTVYHQEWLTGISDFLTGTVGTGYITVGATSFDGPVTATVLSVAQTEKAPEGGETPDPEPEQPAGKWIIGGEGNVTVNDDDSAAIAQGSMATWNEEIDFAAEDLDLSIKFKAPFANSDQYIRIGVTADVPTDTAAAEDRLWTQWYIADGKFGLHWTDAGKDNDMNGQAWGGGMLTPPEDSTYTLRIYRDTSGVIYVELVGQGVIYHQAWQTGISDLLKSIGKGYVTAAVISWNGPVTATVLSVAQTEKAPEGGETPDPEPEQPAGKWIIGGEGNVTVNDDDSAAIVQGSMATWNEEIDFAAEDLDLSIKFKAPFANSDQYIRIGVTADVPADTAAAADRFWTQWYIVDGKFGLHFTDAGTSLNGQAYGGGMLTPPEDSTYTLRIYRDTSGVIYVELVGQGVIYHDEWQTGISDLLKGIGKGYVTAAVISWNGPVTATVLSVAQTEKAPEGGDQPGGENPDPEQPDPEQPDPEQPDPEQPDPEQPDPEQPGEPTEEKPEKPLVTEGAVAEGDWITERHGTNEGPVETEIVYNKDGSVTFKPVAGDGNSGGTYAALNRPIWLSDPNLNVTFRINMDAFHIDEKNPDVANMMFILSDGANADNPLYTPEGTDKRAAFRLRVWRSYDDELTFPEGVFNAVNQNIISGVMGAYAGSRFMLQDVTTFNFTIKREEGFIRFYIDNDSMYTPDGYDQGRAAAQLSDALLAEFGDYAYLSLAVSNTTSDDCQITVKEVNGEAGAWKTEDGEQPGEGEQPGTDEKPDDDDKAPVTGVESTVGVLLAVMAAAACVMVYTRRKATNEMK